MSNDAEIIRQLKAAVVRLENRVSFLERENTRRKNDVNQVASAIKRG